MTMRNISTIENQKIQFLIDNIVRSLNFVKITISGAVKANPLERSNVQL